MSTTIDQKVVEMRFDNKHFEANVSTTMSSLDKLKQKLRLDGATKGLESVQNTAKKVDVSPIGAAVESVGQKFSALEVVGVTALVNITNSAMQAGKRMISALTIDPVKTGFQEYETQINAVQTILANTQSKGSTLNDVNKALDELNKYADMTIYNFTEMTRNIGTFTAAGVDLDKSVSSIKGIANLAAVSGSTSQQASTAMYQLSQALAAGKVSLMDWNSVVNAGMGGQIFQDALKRTATQMGQNVDALIEKYGSFRESLTQGNWLTADVLTETLTQLSGAYTEADLIAKGYSEQQAKEIVELANTAVDAATKVKTFTQLWDTLKEAAQSGWTQTWELIIGDFEEAKEFLTGLSDLFGGIINASSEARNNLLKGALSSKWSQVVEKINEAGVATEDFNKELETTVKEHGINVEELVQQYGSLEKAFSKGAVSSDLVTETLKRMAGQTKGVATSTEGMTDKLEYFQKVVNDVWNGDYKNGEERIKALTDAGYDYAQVQGLVNKTIDGHKLTLEDLSDTQLKSVGYTDEQINKIRELADQAEKAGTPLNELINDLSQPSGRELLLEGVMNIINGIIKSLGAVKKAWDQVFKVTSKQIYNLIKAFNEMSKSFMVSDETADKITRTFKGVFTAVQMVTSIIGGGFKIAIRIVSELLGAFNIDILGITANIGDAIVRFRDWTAEHDILGKAINKIVEFLKDAIETLKEWFEAFKELPIVQESIERLQTLFDNLSSNLSGFFGDSVKFISDFIDKVKQMDGITLSDLSSTIKNFGKNAVNYFADFSMVMGDVKKSFKGFQTSFKPKALIEFNKYIGWTSEGLGNVIEKIVDFAVTLKEKFNENVGMGEVMAFTFGVGVIATAKRIGDALSILSGPVKEVTNVLKGVTGVLSGAKGVLVSTSNLIDTYTKSIKVQYIYTIAKSIAVLAGSIAVLAMLDQGKVWSSVGAITVLAGVIVGLSFAMGQLSKFGGMTGATGGVSLIGVAGALLVLVMALKQLDGLNSENVIRNLGILGALAAGLAAFTIAIGRVGPKMSKDFLFGAVAVIAFAYALKVMVDALEGITRIGGNISSSLGVLLGMMVALRVLAGSAKSMNVGSAAGFIAMAISLKILIGVMKDIMDLDVGKLKSSMSSFIVVLGLVAALMLACRLAGKSAASAGVGLLAISGALILLSFAIKMMAKITPGELKRGTEAISKLLVMFGLVVVLSKFAGEHATKAGVMLLAMAGALFVISVVMVVLSHIEPDGLKQAMSAITQLILVFAVVIAASYFAKSAQGTMIAIVVAVGLLAVALAALSFIKPENLKTVTVCLVAVMAAFALIVAASGLMKSSIGTLIVMTVAVVALGAMLGILAAMAPENVLTSAAALSLLLTSLAGSMVILSLCGKVTPTAYATLGVMLLTLAGIATILGVLASFNVGPTLEIAESLSLLLISLSAACLILSVVGTVGAAAALQGALALDGMIIIVGGLMAGLGALVKYFPAMEEFLDKGIVILEKIGYGLGSFFGNIIGGFLGGMSSGLPEIGKNLSSFMLNLQGFIIGANMIKPEIVDSVAALAKCILILTGASILDAIASGLVGTSSLADFSAQLVPFGVNMSLFSLAVAGLDADIVKNAALAGQALAEMASTIPNSGGLLGMVVGNNDMDKFAEQLPLMGEAIKGFANAIAGEDGAGLDGEMVKNAALAGQALAEMASTIPNSGGLIADFVGENDMDKFAEQLPKFGRAMLMFSLSVMGIDPAVVTDAANAGKAIAEMAAAIPNSGGKLAEWLGENDMESFAEDLPGFGSAIKGFADNVGVIEKGVVDSAKYAGEAIVSLAGSIPNTGGALSKWFGDNDIGTFGESLATFGEKFAEYSGNMANVNVDILGTTTAAAQSLIELQTAIPKAGGLFSGERTLQDFGILLESFGGNFSNYYNRISTIEISQLSSATTELNRLINIAKGMEGLDSAAFAGFGSALSDLGKSGVQKFIDAFTGATERVRDAANKMVIAAMAAANAQKTSMIQTFTTLIQESLTAISKFNEQFKGAGTTLMIYFVSGIRSQEVNATNLMNIIVTGCLNQITSRSNAFFTAGQSSLAYAIYGIRSKEGEAKSACETLIVRCLEVLQSSKDEFYSAGANAGDGFARGLESYISKVADKAKAMAAKAAEAARKELDIHSPSRVAYGIGGFFGLGFVNALSDYGTKAFNAGSDIASMAKDGLNNAVGKIATFIENGMDAQPTIRPVLDLSDVETGASRLNAMLSRTRAVSISTGMSRTDDSENQNGTVQQVGGATYNFTQNNYSPKALSRIDIYRQTKNQISAMERIRR